MTHKTICTGNYENVYVVGDIHGCYTKLMQKLDEIGFSKYSDLLVSVGDIVDRGNENLECLSLLDEPWFTMVLGNHEDFMVQSVLDNNQHYINNWLYNGGQWYLFLEKEEQTVVKAYCEYIKDNVPTTITLEDGLHKTLICHGDYPLGFFSENTVVPKDKIIWNRDLITKVKNGKFVPHIKDVDFAIFGHTPLDKVVKKGNCMWIDTGAVFKDGELTIINIKDLYHA